MTTATLWDFVSLRRLPGALLDTDGISPSTLRRWEQRGWIRKFGSRRLAPLLFVLTIEGYRAGDAKRTGAE